MCKLRCPVSSLTLTIQWDAIRYDRRDQVHYTFSKIQGCTTLLLNSELLLSISLVRKINYNLDKNFDVYLGENRNF